MPDQTQLNRRNATITKIMSQYEADQNPSVLPVISLEDFFDGNWDESSLAPNVEGYGRPTLAECYKLLLKIRDRDDVQDVLIAIHETPDADDEADFDIWPDSDTIYVLTSASASEVKSWVDPLKPSEVGGGWSCNTGIKPAAAPDLQTKINVCAVWWD